MISPIFPLTNLEDREAAIADVADYIRNGGFARTPDFGADRDEGPIWVKAA